MSASAEADDHADTSVQPAPIRIRGLRLLGPRRSYVVDFTNEVDLVRPMSLISGEISTGKTTILEFIDYCMGSGRHPEHAEILANVRTAQLAIEIRETVGAPSDDFEPMGEVDDRTPDEFDSLDESEEAKQFESEPGLETHEGTHTRYVLERAVGSPSTFAMLYRGDHNALEDSPPRRLVIDPSDTNSISQFLLRACGMSGLRTKVAPTQPDSATQILSFRDVMPLAFLTNRRMDNGALVLENDFPRTLKLRQVVDYFFNVSDSESSAISAQIDTLRVELRNARTGLSTLRSFLTDADVRDEASINAELGELRTQRRGLTLRLDEISAQLEASTSFAATTRDAYHTRARRARELASQLRDRETLLRRFAPLREQYADDIRKLGLLEESRRLFDPLSVRVCPACQSSLSEVGVIDGHCSLCRSPVAHLRHHLLSGPAMTANSPTGDAGGARTTGGQADNTAVDAADPSQSAVGIQAELSLPADALARRDARSDEDAGDIDVAAEKRSVARRLSELKSFMTQITDEISRLRAQLADAEHGLSDAQADLDSATSNVLAPFMTERDQLSAQISRVDGAAEALRRNAALLQQLTERERDEQRTAAALASARRRQKDLEQSRESRDDLIERLSRRFHATLESFAFPKIDQAFLDRALIPHVRGQRYDRIGSSGAMTLIALAWQLSLFEEAVERGDGHPGFLLIDSPQKNLRPGTAQSSRADGTGDADPDIRVHAASIVARVYAHITAWTEAHAGQAQVILVDNEPPQDGLGHVVVRFSGDANEPPYGLIEDAID